MAFARPLEVPVLRGVHSVTRPLLTVLLFLSWLLCGLLVLGLPVVCAIVHIGDNRLLVFRVEHASIPRIAVVVHHILPRAIVFALLTAGSRNRILTHGGFAVLFPDFFRHEVTLPCVCLCESSSGMKIAIIDRSVTRPTSTVVGTVAVISQV
jgi:hypothetical protein